MYQFNRCSVSLILVSSLVLSFLSSGKALGDEEPRRVVIMVMDGVTGKPLEDIAVSIAPPGGDRLMVSTGADGRVSVSLGPGI